MELPEMVEFARKFSVMVRINGPDPKGLKMGNHAFHIYHSGKTTLSASGLLLPRNLQKVLTYGNYEGGDVVVTVASIVEPFLSQKSKSNNVQGMTELIPGAQIDVMVEVKAGAEQNPGSSDNGNAKLFGARVLRLVDVPASSLAIQVLADASSGSSEHRWEVGWSLAARTDSSQKYNGSDHPQAKIVGSSGEIRDVKLTGMAATRIAFLLLPSLPEDLPEVVMSATNTRGDFLLSVGSPFGILSPLHFFNSISVGSVANCYPSISVEKSLLMADIRCLPGMEGGPIFGQNASLVGILNRPLRQIGGSEIQVVIPWKAIEGACANLFQPGCEESNKGLQSIGNFSDATTSALSSLNCRGASNYIESNHMSCYSAPLAVEHAMTSVCLITLDNGVWASGVLLNKQGLILTNAHLVEPWRFGRKSIQSGRPESNLKKIFTPFEDSMPPGHPRKSEVAQSNASVSLDDLSGSQLFQPFHQVHTQIRVRVDLMNSWLWLNARILYVSRGPLDVSLLQLESVPHRLCPIGVDLTCPSPGSKAFAIGHGLLGPRCDLLPSVSSGVVAKVVKSKLAVHLADVQESSVGEVPVMLETTASVHPGSSGGVVVNSSGYMVALVTSNAKHSGGTVIPHMNFSIPSAALEPVFMFAKDMQNMSLLQQLDRPNAELASVWSMMPRISPEPDPLLRGLDELRGKEKQVVKGSRFAKFINDRQELLRKPRHLNATQDLSRDTIPSKL